jgi:adenine-specific DNA-methyltransferase
LEKQKLNLARAQLLAARASAMRAAPTPSEARLWQAICCRKLGVSFKRQFVIGSFIVDFCAPAAHVVVEVDGSYHARRSTADARRERALVRAGYRVLRLQAELVLSELPLAVALVRQALGI